MENYIKLEKIGEGTYGVVYRGQNKKSGEFVAMKRIRLEAENEGIPPTAIREMALLRELRHPNMISLSEVLMEENKLYLIFEHLNMDLKQYLDKFKNGTKMNPMLVKSYLHQINKAILFCHQRRILHRDLKPQNLLIKPDGTIKVADLGLGRAVGIPVRIYTHEVVTLWYRAPEILLGSTRYACPVDVWSLGCIFAEMATSTPLFQGDSEIDQLFHIFRVLKTPTEDIWPGVSHLPDYKDTFPEWKAYTLCKHVKCMDNLGKILLMKMLIYNPEKRINAKKIAVDPYFHDLDMSVKPDM